MTERTWYIITDAQLRLIEEKLQECLERTIRYGIMEGTLLEIDNICDEIRGQHNIGVHNQTVEVVQSSINRGEQNQSQSED